MTKKSKGVKLNVVNSKITFIDYVDYLKENETECDSQRINRFYAYNKCRIFNIFKLGISPLLYGTLK